MVATRIALFPGTFDPITNGHVDLIRRVTRLFDLVVVVTMVNPAKKTLFTPAERIAMIHESCVGVAGIGRIEVDEFSGLLVDYAKRVGASAIVRGLRSSTDFEYEHPMIAMNAHLAPAIDTVCLLASTTHAHISSRLVKEVASLGGSVTGLVPQAVEARLLARVKKG